MLCNIFSSRFPIIRILLCNGLLILVGHALSGQPLKVIPSNNSVLTAEKIVKDYLLSEGVTIKKIEYQGNPLSIGYYKGGLSAIGIDSGIIISTGYVASSGIVTGAERLGKDFASWDNGSTALFPDLTTLTQGQLYNTSILEITFIPYSDTLRFKYCFASEEYPEFSCDIYNDVFGFFIEGPGYSKPTNIALLPGSRLPVAINNLHPPNPLIPGCDTFNIRLYKDNIDSFKQPTYDGITQVFTAEAKVTPCQEYTIRLGIADVKDKIYDSAVFLEAKSFGTEPSLNIVANELIAEGCAPGLIKLTYPTPSRKDRPLNLRSIGSASWDDFVISPDIKIFPRGTSALNLNISATIDNKIESKELILLEYQKDYCRKDTIKISVIDNPLNLQTLPKDTTICKSNSAEIELNGQIYPKIRVDTNYTIDYLWQSSYPLKCISCPIIKVSPKASITFFLDIKDNLGCVLKDSVFIRIIEHLDAPKIECTNSPKGQFDVNWSFVKNASSYQIKVDTSSSWNIINGSINHFLFPQNNKSQVKIQLQALNSSIECNSQIVSFTCKTCPPLKVDTILIKSPSCYNTSDGEVSIQANSPPDKTIFQLGNQKNSTGSFSQLSAGNHQIIISYQADGCSLSINKDITIPKPLGLDFETTIKNISCFADSNGQIQLLPFGGTPPYSFSIDGQIWNQKDTFRNLKVGAYELAVKDSKNCKSLSKKITLVHESINNCLYFPNIFSPNKDNLNDVFYPFGDESLVVERFSIFDRWGELVFQTQHIFPNDPSGGWNGTFKGEECSQGVFVWVAELKLPNEEKILLKGELTLVR